MWNSLEKMAFFYLQINVLDNDNLSIGYIRFRYNPIKTTNKHRQTRQVHCANYYETQQNDTRQKKR